MNDTVRGFTLWFTGLPCSGKTTLADAVQSELQTLLPAVEQLDGDVLRKGLSRDLGFSKEDRDANIERAGFIASLLARNGVAVLTSFVSPYRQMRDHARKINDAFIEVYVRCPLKVCEKRDVKGMYRKAREGAIDQFTGVSDPYEEPVNPEITVDTDKHDLAFCTDQILRYLDSRHFITRNPFPSQTLATIAFGLALKEHYGQFRKGGLPYITHPVAVARMLKEAGFGESVVAAGLLHDVLEDTGCEPEEMQRAVGPDVTKTVIQVTEKDKTVPWAERKKRYLEGLKAAGRDALAVSCADKIHNVESLAEGFQEGGVSFAKLFSGGFEEKIRNYEDIFRLISERFPECPLLPRYRKCLDAIAKLRDSRRDSAPLKGKNA